MNARTVQILVFVVALLVWAALTIRLSTDTRCYDHTMASNTDRYCAHPDARLVVDQGQNVCRCPRKVDGR